VQSAALFFGGAWLVANVHVVGDKHIAMYIQQCACRELHVQHTLSPTPLKNNCWL